MDEVAAAGGDVERVAEFFEGGDAAVEGAGSFAASSFFRSCWRGGSLMRLA